MIKFFRSVRRVLERTLRRFLNNTPANQYEGVAFDALRNVFTVFGEEKGVTT